MTRWLSESATFALVLALLWPLSVTRADTALASAAHDLLERRCMVCHGCYDAPCQLKLEAWEGLQRGATNALVYDGARLRPAAMTRLFDDGFSEQQWRDKGFHSVLDPKRPENGVMYRMLQLKQAHPLPPTGDMPAGFDFSLYREQQCPKADEFDAYASDNPLAGMPYGLPGLRPEEHRVMVGWLAQGAQRPERRYLTDAERALIADWEIFLNGNDNRSRLVARYLYEHLFLANLYLTSDDSPLWFRIVRSSTPPERSLGLVTTRRPYDDPGVERVYYRLQRMDVTPLDKIHMPYRFDRARMERYRELFFEPDYTVRKLPGYATDVASNPFKSFRALPVQSRYLFLLDEARFTIMNFIKGPVCRGQVALNVIEDHFWVMFAAPDSIEPEQDAAFLSAESDNLRLPVTRTGTPIDLLAWRRYAKAHADYQQAKADYLLEQLSTEQRTLDLESIWTGDGVNDNAALTVFRHFDTASVVKGFVGAVPKTAWVIGYSLLERIHYLLVAGFDVYGPVSHQLESRLYMDFLRMEGEFNFLMFMPPEDRQRMRDHWYRDASNSVREHVFAQTELAQRPSDITFTSDDPKREFLLLMRSRLHGAKAEKFEYRSVASAPVVAAFTGLEAATGEHNRFLPQVSFVHVIGGEREQAYTVLRNSGYSNIAQLFREQDRRLPEEDRLTVVNGFIGSFPNQFFQVHEKQLPLFAADILALETEEDYRTLENRYAVRRNAPWFWSVSDRFQAMYGERDGIESGLFDLNRYRGYSR